MVARTGMGRFDADQPGDRRDELAGTRAMAKSEAGESVAWPDDRVDGTADRRVYAENSVAEPGGGHGGGDTVVSRDAKEKPVAGQDDGPAARLRRGVGRLVGLGQQE